MWGTGLSPGKEQIRLQWTCIHKRKLICGKLSSAVVTLVIYGGKLLRSHIISYCRRFTPLRSLADQFMSKSSLPDDGDNLDLFNVPSNAYVHGLDKPIEQYEISEGIKLLKSSNSVSALVLPILGFPFNVMFMQHVFP